MQEIKVNEMKTVNGGAVSISSALNAVSRLVTSIFSVGQAVGSAARRIVNGKLCGF